MNGAEHTTEEDAPFEQCPHEVIRATCGGCNCDCRSCVAINARIAARVIPPGSSER